MIDPRYIQCLRCGSELQLSPTWLRAWWASLLGACVVVVLSVIGRRMFGWGLLTNAIGLLLLAVAYSRFFWRSAVYRRKPHNTRPASDLELP